MEKDTLIFFGLALALVFFGWIDFRESIKTSVAPKKIKAEYNDGDSYIKILVRDVDFFNWKTAWAMAIVMAMCGFYNEMHESNKADAHRKWIEAEARNKARTRESLERFNNDGFVSKEQDAYMEELAKEQKPVHAATGYKGDPEKN
jgi:hypothetical protein